MPAKVWMPSSSTVRGPPLSPWEWVEKHKSRFHPTLLVPRPSPPAHSIESWMVSFARTLSWQSLLVRIGTCNIKLRRTKVRNARMFPLYPCRCIWSCLCSYLYPCLCILIVKVLSVYSSFCWKAHKSQISGNSLLFKTQFITWASWSLAELCSPVNPQPTKSVFF